MIQQYIFESEIASLFLVASARGLQGVYWKKQPVPVVKFFEANDPTVKILARTVTELTEYFSGTRTIFEVPLDIVEGTAFQRQVWNQLRQIPYGKTLSYSDLARKIKNEKAIRAVGTANGKNPIGIIIPCHRVISADGSLGGFAGGLDLKKRLLELER